MGGGVKSGAKRAPLAHVYERVGSTGSKIERGRVPVVYHRFEKGRHAVPGTPCFIGA